jgi:hypothetical protein
LPTRRRDGTFRAPGRVPVMAGCTAQPGGCALPVVAVPRGGILVRGHPEAERSGFLNADALTYIGTQPGASPMDARGLPSPPLSHARQAGGRGAARITIGALPDGCPHEAGGGAPGWRSTRPVPHATGTPRRTGSTSSPVFAGFRLSSRRGGAATQKRPAGPRRQFRAEARTSQPRHPAHGPGLAGLVTAAAAVARRLRHLRSRHPGRGRLVGVRTPRRTLPTARSTWGRRARSRPATPWRIRIPGRERRR